MKEAMTSDRAAGILDESLARSRDLDSLSEEK